MKTMEMEEARPLLYNLQFFAEGEGAEGGTGSEGGNIEGEGNKDNGGEGKGTDGKNSGEKTFSQSEVTAIGTKEKNQGKKSILNLFGCADEETAKKEAEEYKKWKASQQTEAEKREEAEKTLKAEQARAAAAENKLTAMTAGITLESIDDALAIALLKVTDDKPLDKVFEEMKKEQKYSGFFGKSPASGGTGSSAAHNKGAQGGADNIGKRLAESRVKSANAKSSFFSN